LSCLTELKPDIVKLDQVLISGPHTEDRRLPWVTALIDYARDLGIRGVAKSLETPDVLARIMDDAQRKLMAVWLTIGHGRSAYRAQPARTLQRKMNQRSVRV
jgi:hypothetical protein